MSQEAQLVLKDSYKWHCGLHSSEKDTFDKVIIEKALTMLENETSTNDMPTYQQVR